MDRYRKAYPDRTAMGQLTFELLEINPLGESHCWVVGKYHLKRTIGDLQGHFTLLWRKIDDKWVIVADHSS